MTDTVEVIARTLCAPFDPESLEPGDEPCIDGWSGSEPCHFLWRDFVPNAHTILAALSAAGLAVVPREPTEAMQKRGTAQAIACWDDRLTCAGKHVWKAMLTASETGADK